MIRKLNGTLLLIMLLCACANNKSDKPDRQTDSVIIHADTPVTKMDVSVKDEEILSFARDSILQVFFTKEYAKLAPFISDDGILFSPYGHVDTAKNIVLSRQEFLELLKNNRKVLWGYADGTGDPIQLNISQYFNKYVYDVAFLKAEQTSVSKLIDPDSAFLNVSTIYPHNSFAQFYFPGFNKEYEGMDWKSLLLVFKQKQSKLYLLAIIHNQWKI